MTGRTMIERMLFSLAVADAVLPYDQNIGLLLIGHHKSVCCPSQFQKFNPSHTSKSKFISNALYGATAGVGVMTNHNGCWVAMQGTHNLQQVIEDGTYWGEDFDLTHCPKCTVTKGFYLNYKKLKKGIFEALHEFGCKNKPLYMVGHSLGAAGMHYLLYDALKDGFHVEHAYAMENPRPGNEHFAKKLREMAHKTHAWRVSHRKDPVVQVPPHKKGIEVGGKLAFHALPEIFYPGQGNNYKVCQGSDDPMCGAGRYAYMWNWAFSDHCWYVGLNPATCGSAADLDLMMNLSQATDDYNNGTAIIV